MSAKNPLYYVWYNMIKRCTDREHQNYPSYGGRGIRVCDRWFDSFDNFVADVGERPEGHTLDRIDNDGDYCPGNCRWADEDTQRANTSRTRWITIDGESKPLFVWLRESPRHPRTVKKRLARGVEPKQALFA